MGQAEIADLLSKVRVGHLRFDCQSRSQQAEHLLRGLTIRVVPHGGNTMIGRLYVFLWFAVILTAGIFYLAGDFTLLIGVVFGFICFGLTFMGMIAVLPSIVHDELTSGPDTAATPVVVKRKSAAAMLRTFADAWNENGVEIRKPHYR